MSSECDKVGLDFFETAPTLHRARRTVSATPAQVFAVLHDADSWVAWAFPITGVEWTSGFPLEVGSTRTVRMKGDLVAEEQFIAYEDGVRMAFRFDRASKDSIRAFAEDYQVTDLGNGRCVVEWTMAMDTGRGTGPLSKVTSPVLSLMVKVMLRRLARRVESGVVPVGQA